MAEELRRRGLGLPARLILDAHRPAAPLASDLGVAVAPFLGRLGGFGRLLGPIVARPDGIERMIAAIDELEERDAEPG